MLRSMLAATFSAVVAFGALSGLFGEKGDARADTTWGVAVPVAAATGSSNGSGSLQGAEDTTWG
ncbi:hypothetical protein DMT42_20810 [Streptomyces actuosus]|uniref:Uncharacterized protein n=1 Tax=Streptomyces actuosus TaxID=1885 RepID=A0A2U9PEV9_STRAS|nr:hypothetical protein DMT42_20810 [Streptomyces actuosus]